eukprot:Gregarina_sp_Poly_1__16@NODE_1003_length_5403_cov_517_252249_g371_i1_p1_GENE_NODE_1003_length_5403_cov_517_252249_g371_i1NODE_1003_length_5403_cov_517_252249_g371_i1_p1_ORF_typecomplete_len482_score43_45zfCCCH/PF00642_24/1_1e06zfCCCH/PF00642_24/0_0018zfCCCH/PF00642_24/8_4e09zfCCCH/PF00642_24/71zfCCCH_3/PF15663_5/8_2e08zfCCCH_3/PF15663_5/0_018zfCCCH_3/PF15663_5/3_6e03Torus/PF16131_5/0_26Torus/PF16131_5/0_69Torus/PF16131_5/0_0019Torus/PF16131_5/4e03zf_CCCH_4/PF18345_1/0_01zf_CCCH_4/PF18345_1/5_4e0
MCAVAKREPSGVPALPSLEQAAALRNHKPAMSLRKQGLRLALSARGPRAEGAGMNWHEQRGAQTERGPERTGSVSGHKEGSHIEAFYKTRYCRYFTQQGSCWKGVECQFAHSEAELRTPPDLTKTRMCAMFRLGYCKLSATECSFAHSLNDLKATDNFYKTEICSFWANGFCRAGDSCRHAHGEEELRPRLNLADMKSRKVSEYKSASPVSSGAASLTSSSCCASTLAALVAKTADSSVAADSKAESCVDSVSLVSGTKCSSSEQDRKKEKDRCSLKPLLNSATTCSAETSYCSSGALRSSRYSQASQVSIPKLECRPQITPATTASTPPTTAASRRSLSPNCEVSSCSRSATAQTPQSSCHDSVNSPILHAAYVPTPTMYVPTQPFPCVLPTPWMYAPAPVSCYGRQFVGIPLDDALTNEDLDREGFCLGIPLVSKYVTLGFMLGRPSVSPSYAPSVAQWNMTGYCPHFALPDQTAYPVF